MRCGSIWRAQERRSSDSEFHDHLMHSHISHTPALYFPLTTERCRCLPVACPAKHTVYSVGVRELWCRILILRVLLCVYDYERVLSFTRGLIFAHCSGRRDQSWWIYYAHLRHTCTVSIYSMCVCVCVSCPLCLFSRKCQIPDADPFLLLSSLFI